MRSTIEPDIETGLNKGIEEGPSAHLPNRFSMPSAWKFMLYIVAGIFLLLQSSQL
jgi:hypothetical protein